MKSLNYLLLALPLIFLTPKVANAASIAVSNSEVLLLDPNNNLSETGFPSGNEEDFSTGYTVTVTPGTSTQLSGFAVRWDFDVSDFSSISQFTFDFDGILNDPSTLDQLRIGADQFSNFMTSSMPNSLPVQTSLTMIDNSPPNCCSFPNNVNNYTSNGVLSVFTQTEYGTGPASNGSISLTTLEVSADIVGVTASTPEPSSLLSILAVGGIGLITRQMHTKKFSDQASE